MVIPVPKVNVPLNPKQVWNALLPNIVTLFGIVRLPLSLQLLKAELPILCKPSGKIRLPDNSRQAENADAPITVTDAGISIDVMLLLLKV